MTKQESANAELLFHLEQARQALDMRKAALDDREYALDEKEMELQEKQNALEEREKELQHELEAVRKKEKSLDEAVRAVSEIPALDEAVDYILDHASIEIRVIHDSQFTYPFIARRYLNYIREMQKKEAENIRKKAKKAAADGEAGSMQLSEKANAEPARKKSMRKAPEHAFSGAAQPDNGMEF